MVVNTRRIPGRRLPTCAGENPTKLDVLGFLRNDGDRVPSNIARCLVRLPMVPSRTSGVDGTVADSGSPVVGSSSGGSEDRAIR